MFYRLVIILLLLQFTFQAKAQYNTATLTGVIEGAQEGDSVTLYVWDGLIDYSMRYITKYREFSSAIHNGTFSFSISDISESKYFSFGLENQNFQGQLHEILSLYLMEPGDKIEVELVYSNTKNRVASGDGGFDSNKYKASFSGVGSSKYNYAFHIKNETSSVTFLNKIDYEEAKKYVKGDSIYGFTEYQLILWDRLKNEIIETGRKYRGKIDNDVLKLLQTDCIAWIEWNKLYVYNGLMGVLRFSDTSENSVKKARLNTLYDKYCSKITFDTTIYKSPYLITYINYRIVNALIRNEISTSFKGAYSIIKADYTGALRDRLILGNYFTGNGIDYFIDPSRKKVVQDMLRTVKDIAISKILHQLITNSEIGVPAFDFALPDSNNQYISLSQLKGKVVFIDLWYSGCSACAGYYSTVLSKVEEKYKNHSDVVFITISIDGKKDLWKKGLKSGSYTGEHAINLYTDGQGTQHPFIKHYNITGYPSPFLINKDGILIQRGDVLRSETELVSHIEAALAKPMASPTDTHNKREHAK